MKAILRNHAVAIILILVAVISSYAQSYQFYYSAKEQAEVKSPAIKKHRLGDEIAKKMQLLRESYTYKEVNTVTRLEETVIEKSTIFNSVKKISKHLCKGVKKGSIEMKEAQDQLNKVLDIALNIRHQNTHTLESELWAAKEPEAIASIFVDKIVLNQ